MLSNANKQRVQWRMHLPVKPEEVFAALDSDDWAEINAGWLNVLFPLKAWLIHGVDLRNHDPARSWNQGYADQ